MTAEPEPSTSRRWPAVLAGFAASYAILTALVMWPVSEAEGARWRLSRERDDLAERLRTLQKIVSHEEEFEEKALQLRGKLEIVQRILPREAELRSLEEVLRRVASDAGVTLVSVTPRAEVDRDSYREVPVDLEARGTLAGVAGVLRRLSRIQRLLNIGNARLERLDVKQFRLTATITAYRWSAKPGG